MLNPFLATTRKRFAWLPTYCWDVPGKRYWLRTIIERRIDGRWYAFYAENGD